MKSGMHNEVCLVCGEPAEWMRSTQFAGDHPFCKFHALKESDFYDEPDSYTFWYELKENEAA